MQQPLLLPSAHTAVLVTGEPSLFDRIKAPLFVFGVLTVLLGGLDLADRIPAPPADDEALQAAFAPAVTLVQTP